MKNIGPTIRHRRTKLGWTVQKLATLSGLNNGHLSRLERGEVGWSEDSVTRIAGALGVSPEVLLASNSNVEDAPADTRRIPVLDYVQAGNWRTIIAEQDSNIAEFITTNLECPPSTFALRIRGDSMLPEFVPGDIVIIAPPVSPRPGDFVVASDGDGDATFKRYRDAGLNERREHVFELVPLNEVYPILRSDRQQLAIVGTMIEHRRFRRP